MKQLRRYLGMIQYYNRFIPKAADFLAPLNDMLRGNVKNSNKLSWSAKSETAFVDSKTLLASSSLLVYPNSLSPVAIFTDASDAAIGAVLQIKRNGVWCPVAFFSRRLDKTQSQYATFDRELLAVYSAVRHFRHFLECKEFAIYSDHKPLVQAFHSSHSQELGRRVRQMSYSMSRSLRVIFVTLKALKILQLTLCRELQ